MMLMKATNHFSMKAAANRWFKGIVSLFCSLIYPWHFNAAHIFVVMTAGNYVEVLNGSISIFCPESSNAMPTLLHQAVYFQCLESLKSLFQKSEKNLTKFVLIFEMTDFTRSHRSIWRAEFDICLQILSLAKLTNQSLEKCKQNRFEY